MTNATRNALKKAARNADAPRVVIGYIRVSTAGQVTEGVSLEAQRARISAYATAQGCRLAEVFEDA
jgi:DNA invertase Pin-like site-specific DNA recombinase